MLKLILILLGSALLTGALSKRALITPYGAGAFGLFLGSLFNLTFAPLTFTVILLYLTASLGNAIPEADGEGVDTSVILNARHAHGYNRAESFLYKTGALVLFTILPIGKPDAYISGFPAFVLAIVMLFANLGNSDVEKEGAEILAIPVQTIILSLCLWFAYWHTHAVSPMLGIISAIAVPKLLFPDRRAVEEVETMHDAFSPIRTVFALLIVWLTPGFSTSAVTACLYPTGRPRLLAAVGLEGAVEGYVLHLLLNNQTSGKSPLGDLLALPYTNWGSFTLSTPLYLLILAALILAPLCVIFSPLLPISPTPFSTAAIIMCQAVVTLGVWAWLFLAAGCLCLFIRRSLSQNCKHPKEETEALALFVPMLFG